MFKELPSLFWTLEDHNTHQPAKICFVVDYEMSEASISIA
jgi:hypothetical protein